MSYTCKITAAVIDNSGGNANIIATLVVADDAAPTVPILTRSVPTNGMNGDQLKAYAGTLISSLLVRDSFYPTIKAAADAQFILAQG